MATISKKISETDYERIGDTQGLLIPQGARFTRFRPPNIAVGGSSTVRIAPTAAQCAAGGGENWNNEGTNFFVPKAGVYTVTLPDFNTENTIANIVAQVVVRNAANTAIETKSVLITTAVSSSVEWQSRDISIYVPEGGRIQAGFYTYQDPGTILFDDTALGGFWLIYLNEVQTPYIVANKGALASSDDVGKVKIDSDDGTMSVSGEVGVSGINLYSLNRPDLWPDRTEIDFGSGLYGKRFSGTFTGTTVTSIGMGIAGTTPATFKVVNMGGWAVLNSETNGGFAFGHGEIYVVGDNTYQQVLRIDSTNTRTDAPYDVWVTYRK